MKYKVVTHKTGQEILYNYGLGASSQSILGAHLGVSKRGYDYPTDSSDFMRCLGVVIAFDIDINIMKDFSYIWNRIIKDWDKLATLGLDGDMEGINLLLIVVLDTPKTSLEAVEEVNFICAMNRAPESCETKINLIKNKYKGDETK